ncbi:MAG: hypothetical protein K6D38_06485 [Pseudobutyrivibrio sp.]|nr:hypothetical protein [Pseudobutyrivibrio sp.]
MNLLIEGIQNKTVLATDQMVKLTVDGVTDTYPVYRVRLNNLYYNDQNDRIATWISQYKAEHGDNSLNRDNIEHYNDVIQSFIVKSNEDKIKLTQENIRLLGQQKYGVVLTDGRIIDGNRRYTCLRNLAKEQESFNYFETVILDRDFESNAKQIKMLELQIQIGSEERVDYDPIDRLVGVYRDVEENKLLTVEEYAKSTNQKVSIVKKELEIAQLIVEFLDSIKAPKQYYLARELQLDGPIRELYGALNNINDEDKKQEIKYIAFANLLVKPDDDMTRFVRNLKGISKSVYIDEFIEQEAEIAEEVLDNLPSNKKITSDDISNVRKDDKTKEELKRTMQVVDNKVRVKETRDKPNQMIKDAIDKLKAIDPVILKRLKEEQIDEMKSNIEQLEELIDGIKEELNV